MNGGGSGRCVAKAGRSNTCQGDEEAVYCENATVGDFATSVVHRLGIHSQTVCRRSFVR